MEMAREISTRLPGLRTEKFCVPLQAGLNLLETAVRDFRLELPERL